MRQWRVGLERSPRNRKVWCSNPSRDRPKSLKQEVTGPLLNPLKNTHCLMAMSAVYRSKFATFHWQGRCVHIREKFSSGTKNPKQTSNLPNYQYTPPLCDSLNIDAEFTVAPIITNAEENSTSEAEIEDSYITTNRFREIPHLTSIMCPLSKSVPISYQCSHNFFFFCGWSKQDSDWTWTLWALNIFEIKI